MKYVISEEELKDLYYPNIAISESGGAGIVPIPDIDRGKIIEVLDSRFKTQLRMYLIELYSVTGKLTEKQENDIKDYMKESADEIIKVIRGGE